MIPLAQTVFFLFCVIPQESSISVTEASASGSSQKIPALVLGAVPPIGAISVIRKIRSIRMKLPSRWLARGAVSSERKSEAARHSVQLVIGEEYVHVRAGIDVANP